MIKEKLIRKIEKICSKEDRTKGLCGCNAEIKVGQTNGIPKLSTDVVCYKKVL